MKIPRLRVAVSVDGLPEHHHVRRKPATYKRILENIQGREVNIHWVITHPMLARPGYLKDYVSFWSARPRGEPHLGQPLHPGALTSGSGRMRWSWKIGKLAGINVYMHATFVLLILFILLASWSEGHNIAVAVSGVVFVLAIFGCIVLHELGHALTARKYGIQTRDIVLLPIGGVARLERMPDDPHQELLVALGGPAVNVVIAVALYLILAAFGSAPSLKEVANVHWVGGSFLNKLMVTNLWLVGFNILPAFPMDGGRVLRALLATRMEYTRATHVAAQIGQAMAFLFGFIGLFYDPFLLFIALFVWMGATEEAAMVTARTSLGGVPVQRVMLTDFRTLNADDPLSTAVDHILEGWQQDFPVVFGDRVLGILTRDDVVRTLAQQGASVKVRDAMRRDVPTVDSHDMLEKALPTLAQSKNRSIPVEHNGRLVGMLTMENVGEFIMIQTALRQAKAIAGIHKAG